MRLKSENSEEEEQYNSSLVPLQKVEEDVIVAAEEELKKIDPAEFSVSPAAFLLIQKAIADYIHDLISESAKEAKRENAETMLRSHVERANGYLHKGKESKPARHLGTFGGLLLGAAISQFLSMAYSGSFPVPLTSICILMGIAGAIMLGY